MVTYILERRLIVLFIDGLFDPLRGWIKTFNPPSLQEAIKKARDMESSSSKNKFLFKTFPHDRDKRRDNKENIQPKETPSKKVVWKKTTNRS